MSRTNLEAELASHQAFLRKAREFRMSPSALSASLLLMQDSRTQGYLATNVGVTSASVSTTRDKMIKLGYWEPVLSGDGRRVVTNLTTIGREAIMACLDAAEEARREVLEPKPTP